MNEYIPSRPAGIFYGLLSSATFGLIPLFTLPLIHAGIPVETALVYRFAIATCALGAILAIWRVPIGVSRGALLRISALSVFYIMAVLLYFYALFFLPSGVVATIQFLFPVMVMLIMVGFFHEPFRWRTAISVLLAFLGVALLSLGESLSTTESSTRVIIGVLLSLLAGLGNGLYFVGIQVAKLPGINGFAMTFYVMLFGTAFCALNALLTGNLVWIGTGRELGLAFLLALITAVLSNLTLIFAVRSVGSTLTSILGVLEPLTAVAAGCLVFSEPFTSQLGLGVLVIVLSVLLALQTSPSSPASSPRNSPQIPPANPEVDTSRSHDL